MLTDAGRPISVVQAVTGTLEQGLVHSPSLRTLASVTIWLKPQIFASSLKTLTQNVPHGTSKTSFKSSSVRTLHSHTSRSRTPMVSQTEFLAAIMISLIFDTPSCIAVLPRQQVQPLLTGLRAFSRTKLRVNEY